MARILIVEDDADLSETYRDFLENCGYSVVLATRIAEATEHLLGSKPELVTLDLNLPGGSSSAIAEFIRVARKEAHAKIIIISGHSERMMSIEWQQDVELVLAKPVNNQHLKIMIDRLLDLG